MLILEGFEETVGYHFKMNKMCDKMYNVCLIMSLHFISPKILAYFGFEKWIMNSGHLQLTLVITKGSCIPHSSQAFLFIGCPSASRATSWPPPICLWQRSLILFMMQPIMPPKIVTRIPAAVLSSAKMVLLWGQLELYMLSKIPGKWA